MTEILTESFCERCGTRYTFESARPRKRLKGVKVLSRGLKNFVLTDGTSMDEAMAVARDDTDRELTNFQLDAFHKTFNFCMQCRQYTCPNCWNEAEARCLTCSPYLDHESMPAPFRDLGTTGVLGADLPGIVEATATSDSDGPNGTMPDAWKVGPTDGSDSLTADFAARLQRLTSSEPIETPAVDGPTVVEGPAAAETLDAMEAQAAVEAQAEMDGPAEVQIPVEADVAVEAVAETPVEVAPSIDLPSQVVAPIVVDAIVEAPALVDAAPQVDADEPTAESFEIEADAPVEDAAIAAVDVDAQPEADTHERLARLAAAALVVEAVTDGPPPTPSVGEKTSGQTGGFLRRFRPGQNLDAELDAYERQQDIVPADAAPSEAPLEIAALAPEPAAVAEPEPIAESEVAAVAEVAEPEVAVVVEPEDAASQVAVVEPEGVAEPELVGATEPDAVAPEVEAVEPEIIAAVEAPPEVAAEVEPAPVVDDIVAQPTWQMVAPDPTPQTLLPSSEESSAIPAAASVLDPDAEPQWPTRPGSTPAAGLPFLGRGVAPQGGLDALWAESNREVAERQAIPGKPATSGVQPCVSCGLSLSANARFCRRCGTHQAV